MSTAVAGDRASRGPRTEARAAADGVEGQVQVVNMAISSNGVATPVDEKALRVPSPGKALRASGDRAFEWTTRLFAAGVLILLAGIIVSLVVAAWPAIDRFGFSFLFSSEWNPPKERFGALVPAYGTLVTSIIALLIAVPVSFGIALFLTELSPRWLRRPLGTAIELLAAIPSIVYGMWGLLVFSPIFGSYVEPWLSKRLGAVPLLGPLFQGPPMGIGL